MSAPSLQSQRTRTPAQRTAMCALTAPNTSNAASALDLTQRSIFKPNVTPTFWRVGFRNKSLRSASTFTTPCTITGIWTGAPAFDTANAMRWNGNTVATPASVSGALTVPTDGSFVYSSWIPGDSTFKTVGKVISWGLTSTSSGTGYATGNGYQGASAAGAANAGTATLTSPTVAQNVLHLDVIIEYRFTDAAKLVMFLGDSNTIGYSPAGQPLIVGGASTGASSLPHEAWPMIAGAMGGFVAVNLGLGSCTLTDVVTTFPQILDRGANVSTYDAAVISLGVNELGGAAYGLMRDLTAMVRSSYTNRIYWTTIPPRCFPDGAYTLGGTKLAGTLSADVAAAATSFTVSFSLATSTTAIIGTGPNAESKTITGISGTGPYTATCAALTNNHYAGEVVAQGTEESRREENNWLRLLPCGITGVFDFEKLLEHPTAPSRIDDRYAASDYLHFNRGAALAKAQLIVGSGVAPALVF